MCGAPLVDSVPCVWHGPCRELRKRMDSRLVSDVRNSMLENIPSLVGRPRAVRSMRNTGSFDGRLKTAAILT